MNKLLKYSTQIHYDAKEKLFEATCEELPWFKARAETKIKAVKLIDKLILQNFNISLDVEKKTKKKMMTAGEYQPILWEARRKWQKQFFVKEFFSKRSQLRGFAPCPFCGATELHLVFKHSDECGHQIRNGHKFIEDSLYCEECGYGITFGASPMKNMKLRIKMVKEHWNRRIKYEKN